MKRVQLPLYDRFVVGGVCIGPSSTSLPYKLFTYLIFTAISLKLSLKHFYK